MELSKEDHWLPNTWLMNFDYRKEILEKALRDLEDNYEWIIAHQVEHYDYLNLMIDYEMSTLELDLEKIKLEFHKHIE